MELFCSTLMLAVLFVCPVQQGTKPQAKTRPATARTVITEGKLRSIVEHLASTAMKGREFGTPENRAAAEWIVHRYKEIGLEPVAEDSYFHEFTYRGKSGRNVAGILRAADGLDEYVIVGAHYDGQSTRNGRIRPSADDNASGVAALLVLAEKLAARKDRLRRNVVFVSFDAEEIGMVGSGYFVGRDVIPAEKTKFALIMDLIAGRFVPWDKNRVYVMGSEHSDLVARILNRQARGRDLEAEILGTYILEPLGALTSRSDYRAYRRARIPYLFFSTATPWYYHTPYDTPDRLDYVKFVKNVKLIHDVLVAVADAKEAPTFIKSPQPALGDAKTILRLIEKFIERDSELGVSRELMVKMRSHRDKIREIVEQGEMRGRDRGTLHKAIISIFAIVAAYRPPELRR